MNVYLDNGYLNFTAIRKQGFPFNIIWGGRAVGKTYGALKDIIENNIRFMFMRRTQTQLEMISKDEFSPFKPLNRDHGWDIRMKALSKHNYGVYNVAYVDGVESYGEPVGYCCALSTISNLRGFDASDVDVLIYDEFIPEPHARPIKAEGEAFLNAYETINRNRELNGKPPLQVFCLANANALDNPLFIELGIVTKADSMVNKKQLYSRNEARGLLLVNVCDSPISDQKSNTALYKLTGNTQFSRMSLSNEFIGEAERGNIGSKPVKEYKPLVCIGELCVYKHKSRDEFYISTMVSGNPPRYGVGDTERARFRGRYMFLWSAHLNRRVYFEERICEILLTRYFM